MQCLICKQANTRAGFTTLRLKQAEATLVVKRVPAQVCPKCGEAYVSETATLHVLTAAEQMAAAGAEVEVRHYAPQ